MTCNNINWKYNTKYPEPDPVEDVSGDVGVLVNDEFTILPPNVSPSIRGELNIVIHPTYEVSTA